MKTNPIPEILVPPDMEHFEIEEVAESNNFPFKRLVVMVIITLIFISTAGMGVLTYINTQDLAEIIPYFIFTILLLVPFSFSCYFFFDHFQPRLRNPYNIEDDYE